MKLLHARPPFNFCGLEGKAFEDCAVVVLPVPYDSTSSWNVGSRNGPHAIIQASRNMELYDEELGWTPADVGIWTLDELEPSMKSPEETIARVEEAVAEILEAEKFPVTLGGEHSIALGPVRAVNERYDNISVLQLDAHADLRDEYEGTKYNHACVLRRVRELCDAVQVGVRSLSAEEAEFLKVSNAKIHMMGEVRKLGIEEIAQKVVSELSENVYVTIDLDGFDPGELPATGTPEPGGLHWYEGLHLLRRVFEERNVVGFDVTELMPGYPACDFFAARLAYKLIAYKFNPR